MTPATTALHRNLLRHVFGLLAVGIALGFVVIGAPHAKTWMAAHVGTMIGALIGTAMAFSWPYLKLAEKQFELFRRLVLAGSYSGTFINIYGAAVQFPGPATTPGVNPKFIQSMIFFPFLLVLVVSFFWALWLINQGLKE